MSTKKDIINYFHENEDVFNDCVEELDSYNGYLGDNRYYPMEELDEIYSGTPATEILQRAFFGYDDEENSHDSSFNPNRDYFYFNGYGNLVSSDTKDYTGYLDEFFIDELIDNRNEIYAIDDNEELAELFDELED